MADQPAELLDPVPSDPALQPGALQAYLAHWMHEDVLYWSQIRTMMLIQATAVTAAVAVFPGWLWVAPLLAGLIGTIVIHSLVSIIRRNRDVNVYAIQLLSRRLIGDEASKEIERHQKAVGRGKTFERYGPFAFAVHPIGGPGDKGTGHQWLFFALSYTVGIVTGLTLWIASSANLASPKDLPRVCSIQDAVGAFHESLK